MRAGSSFGPSRTLPGFQPIGATSTFSKSIIRKTAPRKWRNMAPLEFLNIITGSWVWAQWVYSGDLHIETCGLCSSCVCRRLGHFTIIFCWTNSSKRPWVKGNPFIHAHQIAVHVIEYGCQRMPHLLARMYTAAVGGGLREA